MSDPFGFTYFDDPDGPGYGGYTEEGGGDGYIPWPAAAEFCRHHGIMTAADVGCAKGFLVDALVRAGVEARGYDVSDYALSFAQGLPCERRDVRAGLPRAFEAVFALGVLLYLDEIELVPTLERLRANTSRFLLVSGYYRGDEQEVPDQWRRITRRWEWWREQIESVGFRLCQRGAAFDSYAVA